MAHFAKIENGVVTQVIVVANKDCGGGEFPASESIGQAFITGPHPDGLALDGEWRQTSYNGNFRGAYAGIGFAFDAEADEFVAPAAPEPEPEETPAP